MNDSAAHPCPRCGKVSHHPNGAREGFCGDCGAGGLMSGPADDLPVAFCATGRKAGAAFLLALLGERVLEIRESAILEGHAVILVSRAALEPLDLEPLDLEPMDLMPRSYQCPWCSARCYEGIGGSHFSWCSLLAWRPLPFSSSLIVSGT